MYSCPDPRPKLIDDTCVACEDDLYYDPAAKSCVEICPTDTPAASKDRYCKKCVDIDRAKPYWKDNMCDPCTEKDGGIFWTGSECAPKCPRSLPIWDETNICMACPDSTYFNPDAKECVAVCPTLIPTVDDDNVCVTCLEKDSSRPVWF